MLREIFILFEVNQLSHREIGRILEIPAGTSKTYLHRARAELKKTLNRKVPWIQNYVQ